MFAKMSRMVSGSRSWRMMTPSRNIFTTPSVIQFKSGVMQPTLIETALPNVTRPLKQNIVNICCLRNKSVLRQLRIVESLMKKTTKTTSNYGGVTFNFNESLDAVVYFYNEKDLSLKTEDGSSLMDSLNSYLSRVPAGQNILILGNNSEEGDIQSVEDLEKVLNVASSMSVNVCDKSFNKIFVSKDSKKCLNEYFDRNEAMRSRIIFEDDIFSMLNNILENESPK